jgi:hypothetical protein
MSSESIQQCPETPNSLFSEPNVFYQDLDDATFSGRTGRKSRLSFETFGHDENGETYLHHHFQPFQEKEAIKLNELKGDLFNFDDDENLFKSYYFINMDINAFWRLIKGFKLKNFKVHSSRDFFNELPWRINLNEEKHQLDRSLSNEKKFKSNPEMYFQSISEYYEWIKDFCDKNCEVVPYRLKDERIVFLPKISPMWFVNGNTTLKLVEKFGYINPSSELCIEWLPVWLKEYNEKIKAKYISANKMYLNKESFISMSDEKIYKVRLTKSVSSIVLQSKFKIKCKSDSDFYRKHQFHYQNVISFLKEINTSELTDFTILNKFILQYIDILNYEIIF